MGMARVWVKCILVMSSPSFPMQRENCHKENSQGAPNTRTYTYDDSVTGDLAGNITRLIRDLNGAVF